MAGDYQPFGYEGVPGTCLWCGRKLHRRSVMAEEGEPGAVRTGGTGPGSYFVKPAEGLGNYYDDCFCGLRCGYRFGLRMARLGKRLQLDTTGGE